MRTLLLVIALGFLLVPQANAQLAAEYRYDAPCITNCMTPANDCIGAGTANPFFVNAAILASASTCNIGAGLSLGNGSCSLSMNGFATGQPSNPNRARWASNWSVGFVANKYFEIILTANPFSIVYVDSVRWREQLSNGTTGPFIRELRTSADGYTGVLPVPTNNSTSWVTRKVTSGLPSFSSTLGIHICGYGGTNSAASLRIDSLKVWAHVFSTLPIELVSFTGRKVDENKVALDWATASERDNDYFTVYRSKDAQDWTAIDSVNGAGNSTSMLYYSLVDEHPMSGLNYYHLRQTDFDGAFTTSPVVALQFNDTSELVYGPNGTVSWADKQTILLDAAGREIEGYRVQHFLRTPGTYFLQTREEQSLRLHTP